MLECEFRAESCVFGVENFDLVFSLRSIRIDLSGILSHKKKKGTPFGTLSISSRVVMQEEKKLVL